VEDKMATEDLKAHLKQLHAGLANAEVDDELRSLLTQLDVDIRALLDRREAEAAEQYESTTTYGLAERTQEITAQFAARHPRLEPALRELTNMLNAMGV
jgi:hypothetical protein